MPPFQPTPPPEAVARLVMKLDNFIALTAAEVQLLHGLCHGERRYAAGEEMVHEGERPAAAFLLVEGLACRYRNMPDGRRQILSILLPGDLCDQHLILAPAMDHSIMALIPTRAAFIPRLPLLEAIVRQPRLAAAFWWCSLQEEAILRERIVALGRRNALARIAYLLCELLWRHRAVGLAEGDCVAVTLTQAEIADAVGLTQVHVSRGLKRLRAEGAADLSYKRLNVLDVARLQAIAGLSPRYLHLEPAAHATTRQLEELGPSVI